MMKNTTTTSDPPPLSYAPPPTWHRRRLFRRIVLCLVVVAMAGAGTRWGPQYYRQARLLYWQRKCMEYRAPADQVVYERGPGAAALLATSREYLALPTPSSLPAPIGREPGCLTSYQRCVGTPSPRGGVLFMHMLRLPSGGDRLVIVRSNFTPDTPPMFIPGFDLEVSVLGPATWRSPPKDATGAMEIDVMSSVLQTPPRVRIFAGQPDPADPAHFTIRYEFNGKRFIADGHLKEWPAIGTGNPWATVSFTTRPENELLPPQ